MLRLFQHYKVLFFYFLFYDIRMAVGFSSKVWFWVKIVLVVVVLLLIFRLMFVNRPQPLVSNPLEAPKITYSTGSIVNSVVEVKPGEHVSYPINLNKRWRFKGNFLSADIKNPAYFFVVDKENYEKYKRSEEFMTVISTGNAPGGRVDQEIAAGEYLVVFDGRKVKDSPTTVTANFALE